MIVDGIASIERYRGLYRGLDVLMDWLETTDWRALPTGRHAIDGDRVYALVQDAKTRTYSQAHYEVHRRYLDLQIDLEGHERMLVTPGDVVPCGDFDEASDKGYVDAAPENDNQIGVTLGNGRFALLVCGEPHMPNIVPDGEQCGPIHKICFKIRSNECWND